MPLRPAILLLVLAGCHQKPAGDPKSNAAPSSPSIVVSPSSAATDEDLVVVFTAGASDPDGDEVIYRYLWSVDGRVRTDLTTDTVSADETTKGEAWSVTVTPTDGEADGEPATAEAVVVNTPPEGVVTLDPQEPGVTEEIVVGVEATDPDDDTVTFTFAWSVAGEATEYADAVLPAGVAVRGETWIVTATPSDGEEAGDPVEASVTFENTVPTVTSVALTPLAATEADTLVAAVEGAADVDADAVTCGYAWYVDGALVQEGAGASLASDLFAKHQAVEVEATPNDGLADGEPVRSASVTIDNTAPSISGVTIDPMPVYEASTLTCLPAGYTDIDGDAESYVYEWTVDGSTVASTASIDGSLFDRGASVACSVTPNDGEADGSAVWSDVVTVSNTAPTLGVASLTNRTPAESDSVAVTLGGGSDDDGDSIAYAYNWHVNGALAATTSTLGGAHFDKGDSIQVEVIPWDGTEYGAAVWSDTAVAVNTAPTVTTASLTPATAHTDDVLTASVSTNDADGDTVSVGYTWYVDGVPISATGATLDGGVHFGKGDEVYVVATPDDGEDAGTALASSSVTILNTAPTAPVVAVSPTDPEDADDLVCDLVTPSTDADGDSLSYTYAWELDGSDAGIASDTVPAASTAAGDAWTCVVVAEDGDDVSTEATDSVSITGACAALDFDGSDDYVNLPTFSGLSSYTYELWVDADSRPSGSEAMLVGTTCGQFLWTSTGFHINNFPSCNGGGSAYANWGISYASWPAGWTHIAMVVSSSTSAALFVDGTRVASVTLTSDSPSSTQHGGVGGGRVNGSGTNYFLDGRIAGVRISNTARYASSFTPESIFTADSSTVALYAMDEGMGTTLTDSSGNGQDGTVVGATWTTGDCP
ncbi:MAG: LamG-like jellyroll fold domain-containing protein [Pseudomonadota bacterium]|nr:LamG-like jellyroll fold domain-containing protein [Pseudomonadota bacterium]